MSNWFCSEKCYYVTLMFGARTDFRLEKFMCAVSARLGSWRMIDDLQNVAKSGTQQKLSIAMPKTYPYVWLFLTGSTALGLAEARTPNGDTEGTALPGRFWETNIFGSELLWQLYDDPMASWSPIHLYFGPPSGHHLLEWYSGGLLGDVQSIC